MSINNIQQTFCSTKKIPMNNLILVNSGGVSRIKCQLISDKLLDCAVSVFPVCLVHDCETNMDFGVASHIIHATL